MDAALRSVEREAAQGDPAAQARLLHERLRAGDLAREDLELAASLGHASAMSIAPEIEPIGPIVRGWTGLLPFLGRLAQRRPMAVGRWLVGAAGPQTTSHFRLAVLVLDAWLEDPLRLTGEVPALLRRVSPDRSMLLFATAAKFRQTALAAYRLNEEGQALISTQRIRLAEQLLGPREEPLIGRSVRRRSRRRDTIEIQFGTSLSADELRALDQPQRIGCAFCSFSGSAGDLMSMYHRPDGTAVCEPCHRAHVAYGEPRLDSREPRQ